MAQSPGGDGSEVYVSVFNIWKHFYVDPSLKDWEYKFRKIEDV